MGNDVSEEQRIRTALSTLGNSKSELYQEITDFIIQQCNDASLRGNIDFYQYRLLLEKSIMGLYDIVYIHHYPEDDDELSVSDSVFSAGANFISLLFTRVYMGRDYHLLIEELKSRSPVIMGATGQQVK